MTNQSNSGQWKTLPPLAIARSHPATAAYHGRIYAFGGGGPNFKSLNSAVFYDPAASQWQACRDMPTLRSGAVTAVIDNAIYVMGGGFKQKDGMFRFLTTVEIYHPETDTWTTGPDLLQPHDYPAVATLDNQIYVLGGHHPDATKAGPKTDPGFDFCERLDIATGQWQSIAPLPTPRFAAAGITLNNKVYAMGGVAFRPEGFHNFSVAECFDPASGTWSTAQELRLPWPAAGLGAATLNGQVHIFGGYSDIDIHNRTARLKSTTGQWEALGSLPSPIAAMGVAVCDGAIYAIGGWADDGRTPINSAFAYYP